MKLAIPLLFLFSTPLFAAAPKVDYLYPAGGQRGSKVSVTLGGTVAPWPAQAWASHPGIQVTPEKKTGQCIIAVADDVPCGVHWIRFFNKDGAGGLRPFFVNQIPEVLENGPNDDPKSPQPLKETTVVVNGRLEKSGDTDVYSLPLKKGQTLIASVEAFQTLRSPMDAVLQILSEDGFVLAHNDDYREMDPFLAFDVPRDGVYLVRVFCFPAKADSRVGLYGKDDCVYRLTLTAGPFIDYAWPLAVERSKPGAVELVGWNIPSDRRMVTVNPDKDSEVAILQPDGFANGTTVRIESHPTQIVDGRSVSAPITLTGRVKDPVAQEIRFDLKKGAKLSLRIDARELDFPLDPLLILLDPAGKQVQRVQSAKLNQDPSLDYTPTQDGKYTLLVRDLHDEGGPRHVFRLRALPAVPDFDAVLATDRFFAAPGKPVEMPITLARKNGLKDAVEFHVEGLNTEAKADFSPAKDPKKNTLVLRGWKDANQPFRLFAQVKGRAETRRQVLANIADLDATLPYLWISAGPVK